MLSGNASTICAEPVPLNGFWRETLRVAFDHISHNWLLANISMDKEMLEKWLKCGFVETKKLFPTEEGTPQGGTISPVLMNMTLDGLERILKRKIPYETDGGR